MRRSLLTLLYATFLCGAGVAPAYASQDATPEIGLADLGLPTLDVSVGKSGYFGIPDSLEAGRYLVSLSVVADAGQSGTIDFVQPPSGMSPDDFLAMLSGDMAGTSVATPAATPSASPASSPASGAPTSIFDATWAGGTFAEPGTMSQVIVDLGPGKWLAFGEGSDSEPVVFEVTGELPSDLPEPEASATLSMDEYSINVSEGALVAGWQLVRIDNTGQQPHFIAGDLGPQGLTADDVEAALVDERTGTPAAGSFDLDTDLTTVFTSTTQSPGTSLWLVVDLQPGTYLLACFFPDAVDGLPHANHGMYTVIDVTE
jgi:hypothetical protein